MCGISLLLRRTNKKAYSDSVLQSLLGRRGPDCYGEVRLEIETGDGTGLELYLAASLLQLRGDAAVASVPFVHPTSGDVLCFNGEVFGGLDVGPGCNDGEALLQALTVTEDVPRLLSKLRGPWSLLFWHAASQTIWFGRDVMGRRSLLLHTPTTGDAEASIVLSSVATGGIGRATVADIPAADAEGDNQPGSADDEQDEAQYWTELPPGIYSLRAGPEPAANGLPATNVCGPGLPGLRICPLPWGLSMQRHCWSDDDAEIVRLSLYVRPEARSCPAASRAPSEAEGALDGVEGRVGAGQHWQALPQPGNSLLEGGAHNTLSTQAVRDPDGAVDALLQALQSAVDVRCACCDGSAPGGSGREAEPRVMILFSGGVDSTLLAALAHRSLPEGMPIDLCNVCFDAGRSPDRLSAWSAMQELAGWAPARRWRLLEVDKTLQDADEHKEHLLTLLHPAGTVMDLNIGAALWLAAAGEGRLRFPEPLGSKVSMTSAEQLREAASGAAVSTSACGGGGQPHALYRSPARIVLLGHGADEQCAGYGRHRTSFRAGGVPWLSEELSVDMRRMWRRNCGRDDRLVSDQGREARHPFLDENVMDLLLQLPLDCIADLRERPGLGDKRILRQALLRLGLPEASQRIKRAIQFGTRIGKLSNRREFGSNRAANRVNAGSLALSKLPGAPSCTSGDSTSGAASRVHA
mmetsp:Transcript_29082/g.86108  ORF Transcript_29082/g.86108 Transcript_29082/m.86108 type:complete len:693 (-) Transcript_29082:89-2167(-)